MNFNITKFFEGEAPVATGGGMSVVEMMAKGGVINNGEVGVAPISIQENKEEPKAQEPAPAATAEPVSGSEKVDSEVPQQKVEEPTQPTPQKVEAAPAKQPTLQEVLNSQQPDTVLKALGLSDKEIAFQNELKGFENIDYFTRLLQEWKSNGNVNGFLKELSTDYTKMSAEDVMRHQLQVEYPKATPQQIEALYKKEVVKAYSLDSDDEDEVNEGKALLEAKAERYRDTLVEKQKNYLLPAVPEKQPAQPDPKVVAQQQEFERISNDIRNNAYTRSLISSNKLELADGFSFDINPTELVDLVINGDSTGELMFDKAVDANGNETFTPKVEHQMLVACVQKYGKKFLDAYASHYKSLGGKQVTDPIENAKPPAGNNAAAAEQQPTSIAGLMAKQGAFNSGGY